MPFKYYKLFDVLNRKEITRTQMRIDLGISTRTLAKISNHEYISMEILDKICNYLEIQPGDVIEHVIEESSN